MPAGLAAAVLRDPASCWSTSTPGRALAQRLLGRFAKASAVGFAGTRLRHPVVTGVPVRADLAGRPSTRARRRRPGHPRACRPTAAPSGWSAGRSGAGRINDAAVAMAARFRDRGGLTLYHVTGPRNFEAVSAARADARVPSDGDGSGLCYRLVAFEENMAALYGAADVVVVPGGGADRGRDRAVGGARRSWCRCPGHPATTRRTTRPSWPTPGAAVVLTRRGLRRAHRSPPLVDELLADPARLGGDGPGRRRRSGAPDAAEAVATLVQAHAR